MRSFLLPALLAAALWPGAAAADHPSGATEADMRELQADLALLDDTMADLPAGHARAEEFRQRADDLRDDLTWLKVQIRRHRQDRREGTGATTAEVDALRATIADLQRDLDDSLDRRLTGQVTLPQGTEVVVRLEQSLSSRTARREDRVNASVVDTVTWEGRTAIPAGTRVRGIVTNVEPAERPAKGGQLDLAFDSIWLDDRTRTDLRTRVVSLRPGIDKSETVQRGGLGAVLGGVLGSIIGGTEGAVIGAILGVGGGIVATKGEDVSLPVGTLVTLQLDRPLVVRP
jgi:hypothetical protein